MKMNEIIRECRKKQNLTQEQVANYLGVTAPAVNKWENGISCPDITLLAPLARVLKTDLDTLLSFHEELSDLEINQFVKEISGEFSSLGFERTFAKVSAKVKEYPNCDKLILYAAQILNGYLAMQVEPVVEKEKYQKQIMAWFEMVAFCREKELANMAVLSLSQYYITNGEYEKAQGLLDQIPAVGFDKRTIQAKLYSRQGLYDKAYEIHESMLYQYSTNIIGNIMQMIDLLCQQKEYDEALAYADLASVVATKFDLGDYVGASSELEIYVKQQKEEECLQTLEKMVNGIDDIYGTRNSNLYRHMKFKENNDTAEMKAMIKKSLEADKELEFLRENNRFKLLMQRLD